MTNKLLIATFISILLFSCNSNKINEVEILTLVKTSNSWNGDPLPKYPDGKPEVSILKYTIPPKTKLKLHQHPEINAGVLIKGRLTVVSETNDTLHLSPGDPIVELVDKWHYGMNQWKKPAEIIVFYAGILDNPITISKSDSGEIKNKAKDGEEEEEEVKNTLIKMWAAIENEDIETYGRYIHPNFTQFGENDSVLRMGKKAEVAGIKDWIENSSNIHTEMEKPQVVINGSVAWLIYYWSDHGTTNGEAFATRGKSTRIFVKEEGRWLCIHGHYTLLPSE